MPRLRPFFSYYGGKHRLAPFYSPPTHNRVIECFAGSAGYACAHHAHEVLLVDKDPLICGIWDYLIHVREAEFLALPLDFDHVDELSVCQEAKHFLGYRIAAGRPTPSLTVSTWARPRMLRPNDATYWNARARGLLAEQLQHIRHWRVANTSYADIPEQPATYFVDPPYQVKGYKYRYNQHQIDFDHLGNWCKGLAAAGHQVIACEAAGASWLPFREFRRQTCVTSSRQHPYSEVIWECGQIARL